MFGDDLLVLARTKKAGEIARTLRDALFRHRAGFLRLKRCERGDFRKVGCNFLGYELSSPNGEPRADISCKNELKLARFLSSACANDVKNNDPGLTQTRKALDSRLRNFRHWPELEEFRRRHLVGVQYWVELFGPHPSGDALGDASDGA